MPEDDDKAGGSRRAPGAGKNENGGWSRTKNESHPPHYTERTSKRKSEGLVVGRPHSDGLGGEAPAEPQLPARQGFSVRVQWLARLSVRWRAMFRQ